MKKLLLVCVAMAGSLMAQNARIRVVHGSPDAPAVDVLVNGAKVLEGVSKDAAEEAKKKLTEVGASVDLT